jgi:hypothetical protein
MLRSIAPWLCLGLSLSLAACNCGHKPPPMMTQLPEGSPCMADDECVTGLCDGPAIVATPTCVRKCADGCDEGNVCIQWQPNRFSCAPDKRLLCGPCTSDADCAYPSDHCIVVNGENVCGRDCAFDQTCPTGFDCRTGKGIDNNSYPYQCEPVNASCACLARGDFMQPCMNTNAYGSCGGIKQCDLVNNTVVCDAPVPQAETCNGMDDNCDGLIDDFDAGVITCGVGACQRSASSCVDGDAGPCTPGMPSAELCDGIDNDCDGVIDNGFPVQNDVNNCGACLHVCSLPHATPDCVMGQCKVLTCDMGWGNCNGIDSDGCEAKLDNDPANCGGCGMACTQAHSTAMCANSMCNFVCAPGWVDLNHDASDGCEYMCTFMSSTDIPDRSFQDANCDGIDGEPLQGIFVSTASGDDGNSGTRAAPMKTITGGINAAVTQGKRDVYVAAGTYNESIGLAGVSGINVAGLYDPVTWQRAPTNKTFVVSGNPALKIDSANNVLVQGFDLTAADGTAANPTSYGAWVNESQGIRLEVMSVLAGRGADGADGVPGAIGAGGSPGNTGDTDCVLETRSPFTSGGTFYVPSTLCYGYYGLFNGGYCNSRPAGGLGGASACGNIGGSGGQPAHFTYASQPTNPAGDNGNAAPSGGAGGQGVPYMTMPGGAPYYGVGGATGALGGNGAGGVLGTFNTGGYVAGSGQNGTVGAAGKGGGGGGGGPGMRAPFFLGGINDCEAYGSAGGGGGGGGCGGDLGHGGLGGGASIGLFLNNSKVDATGVTLKAGTGGNGGRGGDGGGGGAGGAPGTSVSLSDIDSTAPGGNGGKGGDGGRGGHGGGGAGGSSFALVKSNNANTAWNAMTGTLLTGGTAGNPGTSSGNAGAAGTAQLQTSF